MDIMSLKFLWNIHAKGRAGDKTDGISTIHKQTVIEGIKVNKGKGKKVSIHMRRESNWNP